MPLARYFCFVGGVLLALLFILDEYLPKLPAAGGADRHVPNIRIHSERKWPERVVYDTSIPTIVPMPAASTAHVPSLSAVANVSANARGRDAFAHLQPAQLKVPELKKRETKLRRERTIAKRRVPPPTRLVARQPQFGWFGNVVW
jgi:hypothetical protein